MDDDGRLGCATRLGLLGCLEGDTVTTLSDVAKGFMNPGLVVFFVVGGPLCGVLTSMVPVIMLTCAQIQAAADCGVFPKALAKKNKNGVSTGILIYVMLFAIICVLTGSSFGVLMTVFSAFKALGASVYLIILAYMAVAVIYFIARIKYLKGKGRNLIEELKTP